MYPRVLPICVFLLGLALTACSPLDAASGFGNRTAPAACAQSAAPWLLPAEVGRAPAAAPGLSLRAVTYNLHSGLGPRMAFHRSRAVVEADLRAIADAIAGTALDGPPDVVALNEVDFAARRSGGLDQAYFIAEELRRRTGHSYETIRGETWRRRLPGFGVRFGNAVLVRHPVLDTSACLFGDAGKCHPISPEAGLPALRARGLRNRLLRENRGLIRLTINFHGRPVDVLVTHLDAFVLAEREAQAAHLLRRFVHPAHTTLLLGDFNTVPTALTGGRTYFAADRTHDILTSGSLADARIMYASSSGRAHLNDWATYPAPAPRWPLDGILGSLDLVPAGVSVIGGTESDHRGLAVRFTLSAEPAVVAAQRVRHDAIRRRQLAQILRCDFVGGPEQTARARWLLQGTGFLEIATLAERQRLLQAALPPF